MQNEDPNQKNNNANSGGAPSPSAGKPEGQEPVNVIQRPSFRTEELKGDVYTTGSEQSQDIPPQFVSPPPPPTFSSPPTPPQVQTILQPQPASQVMPATTPIPPKRNFKQLISIILTLVVLLVGGFIVYRFFSDRGPAIVDQGGEIVWWGLQEDPRVVQPLIDEYQRKNPNIKVTYRRQSTEDYRERLTNSLASGKGPDIFEIHNSWTPMFISNLEPAPSSTISDSEFSQTYYPVIVGDLKQEKGIIAFPLYYDALTLYVNEDIFTSARHEYPETWNELSDLVNPAKERSLTIVGEDGVMVQAGVPLGITENIDYWPEIVSLMMLQNGVNLNRPGGKPATDAFAFYLMFETTINVWDNFLPVSTTAFARGRVAMYFGPTSEAFNITQTNPSLRYRTIKLPQIPKDRPEDPDVSYATYWAHGVSTESPNKKTSWDFLKFLSSQESLTRLNQARRENGLFEKASPRVDMAINQVNDPILGSVITLAPVAKSWFLADKTFDGENGINTQMKNLFADIINKRSNTNPAIDALAQSIIGVLSQYGITVR